MKIGLDLDGVTAAFQNGWADAYTRWFGRDIDADLLHGWDAWREATHFDTEAEFWAWIDAVPNFWRDLAPEQGAIGGIYKLTHKQAHEVCFISNRKAHTREQTLEWLRRNLPATHVLPDLHLVPPSVKGNVDVQVYVDDNPREIEALAKVKPCVLIFDQPWNREVPTAHNVHRVRGWDGLCKFVWYLEHPEDSLEHQDELPLTEPVKKVKV